MSPDRAACLCDGTAQVLTRLRVRDLQHFFRRRRLVAVIAPPNVGYVLVHLQLHPLNSFAWYPLGLLGRRGK
jgi:hypothetical protein